MGIFKNLRTWQNYAHYLLNGLFLTLEYFYLNLQNYVCPWFFMILTLLIFVNDTTIHIIFSLLPEPFKWDD